MAVHKMPASYTLQEVMNRVVDRGIVIVARNVLFSLLGLEILVLEARVAVTSVDTYLKYAQAVGLIPLDRTRHVTEYVTRGREVGALPPWP